MLEFSDIEEVPLASEADEEDLGCETQSSESVSTQRSIVVFLGAESRVGWAQLMRNGISILQRLSLVKVAIHK